MNAVACTSLWLVICGACGNASLDLINNMAVAFPAHTPILRLQLSIGNTIGQICRWREIIQKLGWTLLHFVWQAAVIALLLAILLRVLRKSTANLRYIIACLALALIVLLPA